MKRQLERSILVLTFISFSFFSIAQERRGLSVGDTCPDLLIKKIINSPVGQAHLSSWKGKMVLLDFMTSRCPSCIKALPKMDSLQQLFKDSIIVTAVTHEKSPAVEKLMKMDYLKGCRVPFVIEDTVLHEKFPHVEIPHIVWLDENRVVKAITNSQYVNEDNIRLALANPKVNWLVKKEIWNFDSTTPLYIWNGDIPVKTEAKFYSAFSAHLSGIPTNNIIAVDSAKKTITCYFKNQTIINLYRNALKTMNKADIIGKTLLIETVDSNRFVYTSKQGYRDEWELRNTFCYEAKFPIDITGQQRGRAMINDLNRFLNFDAHFEYRLKKVLEIIPDDGSPSTKKHHLYATRRLSDFIHQLNATKDFPLIRTGEKDRSIDLSVNPSKIKTKEDLDLLLNENRLKVVPVMREVEVFVIR